MTPNTTHLSELGKIFAHSMVDRLLASRVKQEWHFIIRKPPKSSKRRYYVIDFSREDAA